MLLLIDNIGSSKKCQNMFSNQRYIYRERKDSLYYANVSKLWKTFFCCEIYILIKCININVYDFQIIDKPNKPYL